MPGPNHEWYAFMEASDPRMERCARTSLAIERGLVLAGNRTPDEAKIDNRALHWLRRGEEPEYLSEGTLASLRRVRYWLARN